MARRDEASRTIAAQISKAMGSINLLSATRAGVDDAGNTIYKITYKPRLPSGASRGLPKNFQVPTVTKTITLHNGKIRAPQLSGSGIPTRPRPSEPGGGGLQRPPGEGRGSDLAAAKDNWLRQIAQIDFPDEGQRLSLMRQIENYRGSTFGLSNMVEQQLAFRTAVGGGDDGLFDFDFGFGGGGGGGGFSGPEYVKPDERVVEDFVKGTMISLVGAIDDNLVEALKATYMKDHRRNFDNPNQEIDPSQSVLEQLRQTDQYEEIHALRPDSEDERKWIAQRRMAAQQGGLQTGEQEDFAIQQASIGGDLPDVADAASVAQFQKTGSARGTRLEDKIRATATNIFRGVA